MNLLPEKQEILRYLGHHGQNIDPRTEALIDRSVLEMKEAIKPRYTYGIFTLCQEDSGISLPECNLTLLGQDIIRHLNGCKKAVLLAVTLGIEADNLIRIAQTDSMSRAVVLDACATELTEKLCDEAEKILTDLVRKENFYLTTRFSPGYGDLPIETQISIGHILDTDRKIGLTITEHALMIPRKSVIAILGLSDQPMQASPSCEGCSQRGHCNFQREGFSCEDKRNLT